MTQDSDLAALVRKKEETAARTDLTKDERDGMLRRLRRQIRALGGSSSEGSETTTEPKVKKSKTTTFIKKDWDDDTDEFYDWAMKFMEAMKTRVPAATPEEATLGVPMYAFSMPLCFEDRASPDDLLLKYKTRNIRDAKWFTVILQGNVPLICLGPLSRDTRIEEDL